MKKRLTYYFLFSVVLGSTIYSANLIGVHLPQIIRFYVNDFLIIPMVLTIVLFVIRKINDNTKMTISFLNILYICFLYAILFEFWLPKYLDRYTSDWIDVGLYFISGIVFYILQKEKNEA